MVTGRTCLRHVCGQFLFGARVCTCLLPSSGICPSSDGRTGQEVAGKEVNMGDGGQTTRHGGNRPPHGFAATGMGVDNWNGALAGGGALWQDVGVDGRRAWRSQRNAPAGARYLRIRVSLH